MRGYVRDLSFKTPIPEVLFHTLPLLMPEVVCRRPVCKIKLSVITNCCGSVGRAMKLIDIVDHCFRTMFKIVLSFDKARAM